MGDQVLKLREIEDIFFKATCKMLNLNTQEEQSRVRIAWQHEGAPSWKMDEDVVFLRITPEDNRLARQVDVMYREEHDLNKTDVDKRMGYTRVHKVNWTLYGPNSYDNADLIRHLIFDTDYTKEIKKNNLFLITDVSMPVRVPEFFNKQWWERTDFSATFNEAVIRESKVPVITSTNIKVIENR